MGEILCKRNSDGFVKNFFAKRQSRCCEYACHQSISEGSPCEICFLSTGPITEGNFLCKIPTVQAITVRPSVAIAYYSFFHYTGKPL